MKKSFITSGPDFELLFNETSALSGHFRSSPRERGKTGVIASRKEKGKKRLTEQKVENTSMPPFPHLLLVQQALINILPSTSARPRDYKTCFVLNSAKHENFSANKYK